MQSSLKKCMLDPGCNFYKGKFSYKEKIEDKKIEFSNRYLM